MYFNFLGVAFCDEDLPKRLQNRIEKKMDREKEIARDRFEKWLEENGLENRMGVIFKKGEQINGTAEICLP